MIRQKKTKSRNDGPGDEKGSSDTRIEKCRQTDLEDAPLSATRLPCPGMGLGEGRDWIFVGGLPYSFTGSQTMELCEGFGALRDFRLIKDRETGNYAFCAYQDSSVTDSACANLNGKRVGDSPHGKDAPLSVTRLPCPGMGLGEGRDWIFVGGLPYSFTESQTMELCEGFGALRDFRLIKDREMRNYAFCAYQDSSVTDSACANLNGKRVGDSPHGKAS